MELSEQLWGGLLVIYRLNVKGPVRHDYSRGPVVLSCQFFPTSNERPPTAFHLGRSLTRRHCLSMSCHIPHLCQGSDGRGPGNSDTEGFPHCWSDPKISYKAEVMTDEVHPDTLKMLSCSVSTYSKDSLSGHTHTVPFSVSVPFFEMCIGHLYVCDNFYFTHSF